MSDPRDWQTTIESDEGIGRGTEGAQHAHGRIWSYSFFESYEDWEQRCTVACTDEATGAVLSRDVLQGRDAKESAIAMMNADMDAADPNRPSLEARLATYAEEEAVERWQDGGGLPF